MPPWLPLSQEVPQALRVLLILQLLTGTWLSTCLCAQDWRTCHLDLSILNIWTMLGISFAWVINALNYSNEGLPRLTDTPVLLTALLYRSLPAAVLLLFISLFLRNGIGGGDVRYLTGLAFWLPAAEFSLVLMGACLLSAACQWLSRLTPSALLRYRARALLPPLNLIMIGRAVFLLLE